MARWLAERWASVEQSEKHAGSANIVSVIEELDHEEPPAQIHEDVAHSCVRQEEDELFSSLVEARLGAEVSGLDVGALTRDAAWMAHSIVKRA